MKIFNVFMIMYLCVFSLQAQHTNLFLGNNYQTNINSLIYDAKQTYHTSFRPIIKSDLNFNIDTVIKHSYINSSNKYIKKIFSTHFFILEGEDHKVIVSPVINLCVGKEITEDKRTFTNTRGFIIDADLGSKISFFSSFLENQSVFPNYITSFVKENRVVPGQGYARDFKETGFDYAMSSGYIAYRPNKRFVFQFGHGKHFIGDGYRSLLLSDNTFNYPYLRLQTTFGNIQYTNLYAEFQDINYFLSNGLDNYDQMGYAKKYMSAHYLSVISNKRVNISLFESVIWRMNHAAGSNGFDINYLNPVAMLRPIEFSLNSPDNVLVGLNARYTMPLSTSLYGQFVLDEFSLDDLKQRDGFWANKYGCQLGVKTFSLLKIKGLDLQTEYNYVRPYTYAHHNPQQNYAHYNQALAHPLGANFSELLFKLSYRWRMWYVEGKLMIVKYGGDFTDNPISFGNDIYQSTGSFEDDNGFLYAGRPSDFGINMYQGNYTNIEHKTITLAYIINPKTNLKINLSYNRRDFKSEEENKLTSFISFGMHSDLFNHYYDF